MSEHEEGGSTLPGGDPPDGPTSEEQAGAGRFDFAPTWLLEVAILWLGVLIGFFWSTYFRETGNEAHIILVLLIIILCLVRLFYYMMRSPGRRRD